MNESFTNDTSLLACVIDSAFASSLSVPLPVQQLSTRSPNLDWIFNEPCYCLTLIGIVCLLLACLTCVPNLDWIFFDFCRCPTLIGIVNLLLDCHSVYQNHSVKVIPYHLCLRVEHLSPTTHLSILQ